LKNKSFSVSQLITLPFFEGLYEKLNAKVDPAIVGSPYARDLDQRKYPYAQFKKKMLENWHGKTAAMGRVTDEAYLKRVVEEVPDDCYFGFESAPAIAVGKITDQSFLERIVKTKTDLFIVEAAIGRMTNKKLLREYALRSDQECDQEKYKFGSTAQLEAYKQPEYRRAAKRRLEELE